MNATTRKELQAQSFLSHLTRKELMRALRSLQQQPVHAKEFTRAEVLGFIASQLTPSIVAVEVGRLQEKS
jgi:hypothetical protein